MIYTIELTGKAKRDLKELKKNNLGSYRKALQLLDELSENPKIGTGKPKILKGFSLFVE